MMENETQLNNQDCANKSVLNVSSNFSPMLSSISIVLFSVMYGVIGLISVCGNGLIIVAYLSGRDVRKFPFNTFILNLAIADFFVGAVAIPLYIYTLILQDRIDFNVYIIWSLMASYFPYTSVLVTILMSFDRYQLVSDAIKYNRKTTRKRVCCTIIPAWILSLLSTFIVYATFAYFSNLVIKEPCSRRSNIVYSVYLSALFVYDYFIPLGILVFLNLAIYVKLVIRSKQFTHRKRHEEERTKYNLSTVSYTKEKEPRRDSASTQIPVMYGKSDVATQTVLPTVAVDEDARNHRTAKKKIAQMEDKTKSEVGGQGAVNVKTLQKAGRQLFTLVSVFVVCWLPVHLLLLLSAADNWSWVGKELWYYCAHVLLATNSAINPFLYLRVCQRYRIQVCHIISQVRKILHNLGFGRPH